MKTKSFLMLFLVFFLTKSMTSTNYILNGDFELGYIPNASDQVYKATNWSKRLTECTFLGQSPDLFDSRSTSCEYDIPSNKWATNIPVRVNGNRYVGFSSTDVYYADPTKTSGETIRGTLTTLSNTCGSYNLSFYVHTIDGFPYNWSCTPETFGVDLRARVEVYLVKQGNCTRKLIYSSPIIYGSNNWQLLSTSFNLTPAEIAVGYNKIDIETKQFTNEYGQKSGGILFMDDFSLTTTPLTPSLTGNTNFCDGDALTFNGSVTAGTATGYYWEIAESDAAGVPTTNGYVWNSHYVGNPSGAFTFPTLPLVCGKFYKIKLAVYNGCNPWSETNLVIKINCLPTVDLTDVTLCDGDNFPVNLSSPTTIGSPYKYRWTYNGSPVYTGSIGTFGTTAQVNVVGTFCLTVTNLSTTCVKTDCAEVQYDSRMQCTAEFDASTSCNSSNNVMAVVATFPQMCDGMSFYWKVCELDANNQEIFGTCLENPSTWWTTGTTQNFPGYSFVKGHKYRIYRGVWSVPDACIPWRGIYHDVECNATNKEVVINSGTFDKPFSISNNISIENKIKIYPNPTTGNFTANVEKFATGDLIQVLDYSGKVILEKNINTNRIELNIAEMANGLYFVKVISADGISMEKLIKN